MPPAHLSREATPGSTRVFRELDHARKNPANREIVIPPCPKLLQELRALLAKDLVQYLGE